MRREEKGEGGKQNDPLPSPPPSQREEACFNRAERYKHSTRAEQASPLPHEGRGKRRGWKQNDPLPNPPPSQGEEARFQRSAKRHDARADAGHDRRRLKTSAREARGGSALELLCNSPARRRAPDVGLVLTGPTPLFLCYMMISAERFHLEIGLHHRDTEDTENAGAICETRETCNAQPVWVFAHASSLHCRLP